MSDRDAGSTSDAGRADAGTPDAGSPDAGADAGDDAGTVDDAGSGDGGRDGGFDGGLDAGAVEICRALDCTARACGTVVGACTCYSTAAEAAGLALELGPSALTDEVAG